MTDPDGTRPGGLAAAGKAVDGPNTWLEHVLASRRTVHDFSPEPIDAALIQRALELALAAPNHRLTEPWRFVWVGPAARQQLLHIALDLKRASGKLTPRGEQELRDKLLHPAELLVICRERHKDPNVEREDYAAIACAIHNAALFLWGHGIGTKWSTGAVTRSPETYQALDVPPEAQEIVGFMWVGKPATEHRKPGRTRTLHDVLRRVP